MEACYALKNKKEIKTKIIENFCVYLCKFIDLSEIERVLDVELKSEYAIKMLSAIKQAVLFFLTNYCRGP